MPPKRLRSKLDSALSLKESKISNFWAVAVLGFALFFDIAQAFVELIPLVGLVLALLVSFLGTIALMATLYLGFRISYFSGTKVTLKIASLMFGMIVTAIPLLNLITPEIFIMALGAILATRFEEVEERKKQEENKQTENVPSPRPSSAARFSARKIDMPQPPVTAEEDVLEPA